MDAMKTLKATSTEGVPVPQLIGDVGLELIQGEPQQYVPTGIAAIDDIIVGIVAGEVTLVAAKPSQGKTALAMQILEYAAGKLGLPSAIISMEMGAKALSQRMISARSGVPTKVLRTRMWSPKQEEAAIKAAKELNGLPLYVDDRSGLTGQQVYDAVGYFKDAGIGIVGIDYLQLMSGVGENRQGQVGEAMRLIKSAAKDFEMPVVALSQVNRASEQRENTKPRMSDLRDSGELEQVGDTILMAHYPEDDLMEDVRLCDWHVVKQRNGPTGVASTRFNKPRGRFEKVG
jgi:replicative DNA helicase